MKCVNCGDIKGKIHLHVCPTPMTPYVTGADHRGFDDFVNHLPKPELSQPRMTFARVQKYKLQGYQ